MEIKIGLKQVARELSLDIEADENTVEQQIRRAISEAELLDLTDRREARILINGADIAYVEISPARSNRIGFAI